MKLEHYDKFPTELAIIQQENIIYPFMIVPIFLSSDDEIEAIKEANKNSKLIFVTTNPKKKGVGTIGSILREVSLPNGKTKILFQGLAKGTIQQIKSQTPLKGVIELIQPPLANKIEVDALLDTLKEQTSQLIRYNPTFPRDIIKVIDNNSDADRIIDLIVSTLKIDENKAYELFELNNTIDRLTLLIKYILKEIETAKIKTELAKKVSRSINETNREYFLKQQLQMIQEELGINNKQNKELDNYHKKLAKIKKHLREDAYKEIKKQIDRLSKMHPESAEYATSENYVEWALEIPFGVLKKSKLDIKQLENRLNKDHYGLQKPKERIIDYFAAKELVELRGKEYKGAIICFVGPPGVGKTSLANSIAKSLNRPLIRIALGGLDDVNELRGHRRTYVGSMPGRITQGLINAKSMNPVIVLDEIDKIARHRGDPTSVLLEILDPEQNSHFRDIYLNFELDLSQVIFIATANDITYIPAPLRDRLELIFIDSYTPNEKFEIAKKYLIPQEQKKHALSKTEAKITDGALKKIIDEYTKEAGVRNLRKIIAKLMRKIAKDILNDKQKVSITIKNLQTYLEKGYTQIESVEKEKDKIGVVNGLAWTPVGGDILKIEAIKVKGKGGFSLTGNVGDIMRESVKIAISNVKVLIHEEKLEVPNDDEDKDDEEELYYRKLDIHIHFPAGAIPKDGPSAGIAIVTALSSILSQKKVRHNIAMTGEISLIGDVLPIGGLKEKLIAAYKAKIKKVLIPQQNYDRDLDDIPQEVKDGLEIVPVKRVEEVLEHSLL
jgi:ATP-dependent Lon protease